MEIDFSKKEEFYKEFNEVGAWLTLGLMIVSVGLYIFIWIYSINKDLEIIDDDAPNPLRGIVILLGFPIFWILLAIAIKLLLIDNIYINVGILIGFIFIFLLMIKYMYDFTFSFARVTGTKGISWLLLFILPFIAVPFMQKELNSYFNRVIIRKKTKHFYS